VPSYLHRPKEDCGRETCAWCHRPIIQPLTGRPRKYCCKYHGTLAWRLREDLRARGAWTPDDMAEALTELGQPDKIGAM
jgi:hypothetical protein